MTAALKFDVSSRAFAAALLGTILMIAAAAWFVAVGPKRSQASDLSSQITAKRTQLSAAERSRREAQKPVQKLGPLQDALPDGLGLAQVVDQLNTLAVSSGVTLSSVTNPGTAPTVATGYESVPLTVVVDGRYFAVERFLHKIRGQVVLDKDKQVHATGRLFDIQSVGLEQTEPAPNVTATLVLNTYYYSATAAPAPPVTATTDTTTTPAG